MCACTLTAPMCLLRPHCDIDGEQHYGHQYVEDQGGQKRPTVPGRQLALQVAEAQGAEEEEAQDCAGQVTDNDQQNGQVQGVGAFGAFVLCTCELEGAAQQQTEAGVQECHGEEGDLQGCLEVHLGVRCAQRNPQQQQRGDDHEVPEQVLTHLVGVIDERENCGHRVSLSDGLRRIRSGSGGASEGAGGHSHALSGVDFAPAVEGIIHLVLQGFAALMFNVLDVAAHDVVQ